VKGIAALVFAMNLFAATQDIAVDGLAVSWLRADQLGVGNAAQVVGYKIGMLTGGGLLVWASARIGWRGLFECMAVLMAIVFALSTTIREDDAEGPAEPVLLGTIAARLREAVRSPHTLVLLAVITTYKTGESLAEAMWKPMLLDRGFSAPQIGLWAGTFGMLCSLLGSAASGFAARRVALPAALLAIAAFRAAGVGGQWWVSVQTAPTASSVVAVTCLEHFFAGAITTVVFALMMRHTDRRIGATHYTLLASIEVFGKMPLSALSGWVATGVGYGGLFAIATGLCVAFALVAFAVRTRLDA
jgi:hypothetical protein